MRTTLDIADDVLFAAREIARRERKTIGQVVSERARRAFQDDTYRIGSAQPGRVEDRLATYGIHPLPSRGGLVTNEQIDRLRDAEGV